MLSTLRIENFGLAKLSELVFDTNLNAITGESGSGKSLVLDALGFVLGASRFRSEVRPGVREGHVSAQFELDDLVREKIKDVVEGHGIAIDSELVLSRHLDEKGRTRCYVQGRLVPRALLAELASELVEVSGQGDSHALRNPKEQLFLLDEVGGLEALRSEMTKLHLGLSALEERLRAVEVELGERDRNRDFLEYQRSELEGIPDFDFERDEERLLELEKAGERHEVATKICEELSGNGALADRLRALVRRAHFLDSPDLDAAFEAALVSLDEISKRLSADYSSDFENERERKELESRKSLVEDLARKYRLQPFELVEKRTNIEGRLARLEALEEERTNLEREIVDARKRALLHARMLHDRRREVATSLLERSKTELTRLGLAAAEVHVELGEGPLGPHGTSVVNFGYSAHPSMPPRPLAKVASGGELGRVLLALRLASGRRRPLLVLDEIDAGVGGNAASELGECLKRSAKLGQILFVSHWAQVAAKATAHYRVTKIDSGTHAESRVERLDDGARLEEIARMLGGDSESLRKHAATLVEKTRGKNPATRPLSRVA